MIKCRMLLLLFLFVCCFSLLLFLLCFDSNNILIFHSLYLKFPQRRHSYIVYFIAVVVTAIVVLVFVAVVVVFCFCLSFVVNVNRLCGG